MSATNVPQLPHSGFPQVKIQLCPLMAEMVEKAFAASLRPSLGNCCHETVVSCEGTREFDEVFCCNGMATVHDLESDLEYCAPHFRALQLRRSLEALSQ